MFLGAGVPTSHSRYLFERFTLFCPKIIPISIKKSCAKSRVNEQLSVFFSIHLSLPLSCRIQKYFGK